MTWSHPVADVHGGVPERMSGRELIRLPLPGDDGIVEKILVAGVWTAVMAAETHEMMEHFQLGGVCVYDPHTGGKAATSPKLYEPDLSGLA